MSKFNDRSEENKVGLSEWSRKERPVQTTITWESLKQLDLYRITEVKIPVKTTYIIRVNCP